MPSGLIALLDDVAMIAKLASASLDDIGARDRSRPAPSRPAW